MTREETIEAIKVMQAFVDGAEIQRDYLGVSRIDVDDPGWNWFNYTYYIKPKPPKSDGTP